MQHTTHHKKGFTLIEGLVLLFIFVIGVLTFYQVFVVGTQYIIESKRRLAAVAVANEEMEILRNTPYKDLFLDPTTTPGPPSGSVEVDPDNGDGYDGLIFQRDLAINDISFRIFTEVNYIEDDEDGLSTDSPADAAPNDYKKIRVSVLWGGGKSETSPSAVSPQKISLTSRFIPPNGLESAVDGGILSVNVFNSSGAPISGATIRVFDSPGGNAQVTGSPASTDVGGNVLFYGLSAGTRQYRVEVSATSYETIVTLDTTSTLNPIFSHQTVLDSILTSANIYTELVQDFDVYTKDPFCNVIGSISFDITGGRVIGTNPSDNNSDVYTYDNGTLSTNGSGEVTVYTDTDGDGNVETGGDDGASAGSYVVSLNGTAHEFWKLRPGDANDPARVTIPNDPNVSTTSTDCNFIVMDQSVHSLFIPVVDAVTGGPLEDAKVSVDGTTTSYGEYQLTDEYGAVYFPNNEIQPLVDGETYTVTVEADGYNDSTESITVSGLTMPSTKGAPYDADVIIMNTN